MSDLQAVWAAIEAYVEAQIQNDLGNKPMGVKALSQEYADVGGALSAFGLAHAERITKLETALREADLALDEIADMPYGKTEDEQRCDYCVALQKKAREASDRAHDLLATTPPGRDG